MQDQAAELLDIREAADFLRVSETSLRRWTNAGRLPCLRVGGRRERRFRRSDLLAFVGSESGPALQPAPNHFCGLYSSDLSRARAAAAFLDAGLQTDALCLLVAAKDVQNAVVKLLGRAVNSSRFVVAEYHGSAAAQFAFWRARLGRAARDGASRVHVVGDVSGGALGRLPVAEILEYEAEFGRSIAREFPVLTLCQYDARRMSGLDVAGVIQCHDGLH